MKLYVGNLSYSTTEDTLKTLFSNYADVASVTIMRDRFTQQSKGFGFVEIEDEIKAQRAIGGMNGKDVDGRRIRVSEAVEKPRRERSDFDGEDYRSRPRDYERRDSRDYDRRDSRDYERRDSRDYDRRDSRDYGGSYDRRDFRDYGGSYERRGSDYSDSRDYRDSERRYSDSRRDDRRNFGNDRDGRNYERRGGYRSSERRGGSYGRFSRRDDNPDEY